MSQQWSEFGSDRPNAESDAAGSLSANGATPEEPLAAQGEPANDAPTEAGLPGEALVSEAADDAAATPTDPADVDGGAAAAAADDGSVFLAELVRAMQSTAGIERARVAEDTERRRQEHIALIRARQTSEADRMRELAGEDGKAIDAWAETETKRIQLERERRSREVDEDLEASLATHRSKIEREIDGVEAAIAAYQVEIDEFFASLDRETDLIVIARQAAKRPVFPTSEALADAVAASSSEEPPAGADDGATAAETAGAAEPAVAEPVVVGVMDPQRAAEPTESWTAPPETSPEPALAGTPDDVDQTRGVGEAAEPLSAATGPAHRSVGSLLESVPVLRPMSWPRRDASDGDRSNRDG